MTARRQPTLEETAVPGTDGALTEQYRTAVTAALPAGVTPPDEFWRDLEAAIADFSSLQQHRAQRLKQPELKRWQKVERGVSKAAAALGKSRRPSASVESALADLRRIKRMAEAGTIGHRMLGAGFRRRENPHRAYLYGAICDLWRRRLGQELRYSRSEQGPGGPLIRFLGACLRPVLGAATPTASGLASIIDRERKRLADFLAAGK